MAAATRFFLPVVGDREVGFGRTATATSTDDLKSMLGSKYLINKTAIEEAVFDLQCASTAVIRL
jgi:hypothetical protein